MAGAETADDEEEARYSLLLDIKVAIPPALGVEERQSSLSLGTRDKEGEEDLDDSSNESESSLAAAPSEVSTVAVDDTSECLIGERAVGRYTTGCCRCCCC